MYGIQLKHHVAVLGLKFGLYVKSSATGIIYIVMVSYPQLILNEHIKEVVSIVAPSLLFLYKKGPAQFPHVRVEYYKHAQDSDVFAYNIKVWRAVDMYIRRNGHFPQGASVTLGPHALWPTVKPYVDFMSR